MYYTFMRMLLLIGLTSLLACGCWLLACRYFKSLPVVGGLLPGYNNICGASNRGSKLMNFIGRVPYIGVPFRYIGKALGGACVSRMPFSRAPRTHAVLILPHACDCFSLLVTD
jgi:hypothetical protein